MAHKIEGFLAHGDQDTRTEFQEKGTPNGRLAKLLDEFYILRLFAADYWACRQYGASSMRGELMESLTPGLAERLRVSEESLHALLNDRFGSYSMAIAPPNHTEVPHAAARCLFGFFGSPKDPVGLMSASLAFQKMFADLQAAHSVIPKAETVWSITCPLCGNKHKTSSQPLGKRVRCAACRGRFFGDASTCIQL